jgi:hypothetical protein
MLVPAGSNQSCRRLSQASQVSRATLVRARTSRGLSRDLGDQMGLVGAVP